MTSGNPKRRASVFVSLALLLSGCSSPYEEDMLYPHNRVSGPAGIVWFVPSLDLRKCSWFECGESSTRTLGSHLRASRLTKRANGSLVFETIAKVDCPAETAEDCDIAVVPPRLRYLSGTPRIANDGSGSSRDTVAWLRKTAVELRADLTICIAGRFPSDPSAQVVKVAPAANLRLAAQVVTLAQAPLSGDGVSTCAPLVSLPRPAREPEHLFLSDAVKGRDGKLHITYLAKKSELGIDPPRVMLATYDGIRWEGQELPVTVFGGQVPLFTQPGFLDDRADRLILDAVSAPRGATVTIRVFDRLSSNVSEVTADWR